jgi:hypothetical protein
MNEFIKKLGYDIKKLNAQQRAIFKIWYKEPRMRWLIQYHLSHDSTPNPSGYNKKQQKRYNCLKNGGTLTY